MMAYFGLYVQNDWRLSRKLMLNVRLRHDVQVPFVERWNRLNNGFDFHTVHPLSNPVLAAWRKNKTGDDANRPIYPYPKVQGRAAR